MSNREFIKKRKRIITLSIMLTAFTLGTFAQSDTIASSEKGTGNFFHKTGRTIVNVANFLNRTFSTHDTLYVTPNKYQYTVMTQYCCRHEFYNFSSFDQKQSITIIPEEKHTMGVQFGWKWILFYISFNLDSKNKETDFNFSCSNSRCGLDLFYRKRSQGFRISDLNGFYNGSNEIEANNRPFNGISISQIGANAFYIFNNKRFSYRSAYGHSTVQRVSAGGFILGASYNKQDFIIDSKMFDSDIKEQLSPQMNLSNIKYHNISINAGYSYNWVFARNFIANGTLSPAIGYKSATFKSEEGYRFVDKINLDLVAKASVVYNNTRWYAGTAFIFNTYSYRKDNLSAVNGLGTFKLYIGINFIPRKKR